MANPLAAIVAPVTGLIQTAMENKRKKREAVETRERILTEAAANNEEVAGQIALARTQQEKDSWKDEMALLTITLPYWVAMVSAIFGVGVDCAVDADGQQVCTDYVKRMFENMESIPAYWQETFQYAIWGALSIVGVKRVFPR